MNGNIDDTVLLIIIAKILFPRQKEQEGDFWLKIGNAY